MCVSITIESVGRRHYFRGNTYPVKDALRNAGAHWDGETKAWWIGKRDVAEQLVAKCCEVASATTATTTTTIPEPSAERPAPGKDAVVGGKATYKGRTYYVGGRVVRGRTHWDDRVEAVTTRAGAKMLLIFRDGSKSLWAPCGEVQIVKSYERACTIAKLERRAEDWRAGAKKQGCGCSCHREANAGAPGSILYDGCERCGCES
jgi:hypothetical protein